MKRRPGVLSDRGGAAMVITLMVLALVTALVVEFAHGVYVNTAFLGNWLASQRLSLVASSGTSLAARLIDEASSKKYTYPGSLTLPDFNPFDITETGDGVDLVTVNLWDENSRFNLNSIVYANGEVNEEAYVSFNRLLDSLDIDPAVSDSIADWLDKDPSPRGQGTEDGAKNAPLDSVDEILLVPGVDPGVYDKLSPYVTIYGGGQININGAETPVLMSLSGSVTEEMAGRIVQYREIKPFENIGQLTKVAGFEKLGISLAGKITVQGSAFGVSSVATSKDGLKRVVSCVMDRSGRVLYWKEM